MHAVIFRMLAAQQFSHKISDIDALFCSNSSCGIGTCRIFTFEKRRVSAAGNPTGRQKCTVSESRVLARNECLAEEGGGWLPPESQPTDGYAACQNPGF